MKAWEIVGYTYKAEQLCPSCTIGALPTGTGEQFDGWKVAAGIRMSAEANLDELAFAFGIDRTDEYTFDSDEFPKVIFASQVDGEHCDKCGGEL